MLSSKDISVLLNFKAPDAQVVSLYLELGPDRDPDRELETFLGESFQKTPALRALEEELSPIRAFVKSFRRRREDGLAIFSARNHGLWQAIALPQRVKTLIRLGGRPFLKPLVNILDQHHRYGVVLIDETRARFIEVYMNQGEEAPPPCLPQGEPLQTRLKSLAAQLMSFARARGIERVVLGAEEASGTPFLNHLHSFIQNNLILDSQMGPKTPLESVIEKITEGEKQSRIVLESVLVHRLLDSVRRAGMAVVGLQNTLDALQKGQIRLLILKDSLAKLGRRCPACRSMSLAGRKCSACGATTESVFDLVQEIAQAALEQDCEVFRVYHDRGLDAFGGIGAELRFQSEPSRPRVASAASKVV